METANDGKAWCSTSTDRNGMINFNDSFLETKLKSVYICGLFFKYTMYAETIIQIFNDNTDKTQLYKIE